MQRLLLGWTGWVIAHAVLVLTVLAIITAFAGYFAVDRFSMNSDTGQLIRQETPWKAVHNDFIETFPHYDQNTIVVLSGNKPNTLVQVTRSLTATIKARDEVFSLVYAPSASEFADQHSLLYLDLNTLNDTVSKLADAQPFLTAVAQYDDLTGILDLLADAMTVDEELPTGISQISDSLKLASDRALSKASAPINWRDELFDIDGEKIYYQLIFVKGRQEFGKDLPNGLLIGELESIIASFQHPAADSIRIRLSGQVPLEHGEIVSAFDSAQLAGTLALVMLIVVLVWGVRSARIIAATYLSMLCGLVLTAAFAMIAVGQYNTISIIFLVMFIGLGVDFAIHLCLKYQESVTNGDKSSALLETGTQLGPAIMLCGITSALGFLCFVPTDYIGLAEMGIISGGGMIIAVVVSLTLIPAFFAIVKKPQPATELPFARTMSVFVAAKPRQTSWVTFIVAIILAAIASQARFDYSTLSLKDPNSEAMTTLTELHKEDIVTDYSLTYISRDLDHALTTKKALLKLKEVSEVVTPADYLPDDQSEKLSILEDAGFLLDSVFYATPSAEVLTDKALVQRMQLLNDAIGEHLRETQSEPTVTAALDQLQRTLATLISANVSTRQRFTDLIVPSLKTEIEWLRTTLAVETVTLDSLPAELRQRLIAPDNRAIVSITPSENVMSVESLRSFTEAVIEVAPEVTGRPVLDLGIGDIVTEAFAIALSIAVVSIFIILVLTLHSVLDATLVFIPLAMTALVTLSVSVLAGLPLNMANIVVIPLIFGLGVDNGIHIVKRYHQVPNVAELVHSSTPKAVFLSNLTTIGTFCALSFSTHQGIYSIGVLLTVALICLMLLTLISLPALLATFSKPRGY
ncbi:MAG: MMPL family transporter [Gammaproteobacteria bacterium]|nr:MMPL family transporter [Gammaproteobacteria bacterium]